MVVLPQPTQIGLDNDLDLMLSERDLQEATFGDLLLQRMVVLALEY